MRDGSIIASFTAQRRLDQLLAVNQGLWVNYLSGTSEPYCLGEASLFPSAHICLFTGPVGVLFP